MTRDEIVGKWRFKDDPDADICVNCVDGSDDECSRCYLRGYLDGYRAKQKEDES